jgi:hypothetical protein
VEQWIPALTAILFPNVTKRSRTILQDRRVTSRFVECAVNFTANFPTLLPTMGWRLSSELQDVLMPKI